MMCFTYHKKSTVKYAQWTYCQHKWKATYFLLKKTLSQERYVWEGHKHTLSIAFLHPPPNSATEGVLFITAQLSSDAVSTLQKVRVLIWL